MTNRLLELLEDNVQKITFGLLIFTLFFVIIALLLINSSIILSIFSKRFTIKTMQLVGAKKSFIRKPFILNNILLGFISSLISLGALSYFIYIINRQFPELKIFNQTNELVFIYLVIMIFGIIISGLSTFFATQRYLNLKTNAKLLDMEMKKNIQKKLLFGKSNYILIYFLIDNLCWFYFNEWRWKR